MTDSMPSFVYASACFSETYPSLTLKLFQVHNHHQIYKVLHIRIFVYPVLKNPPALTHKIPPVVVLLVDLLLYLSPFLLIASIFSVQTGAGDRFGSPGVLL